MGNLGDESAGITTSEERGDFGASFPKIGEVPQVRRILELVTDIGVGESMDRMFASQQCAEDLEGLGEGAPTGVGGVSRHGLVPAR